MLTQSQDSTPVPKHESSKIRKHQSHKQMPLPSAKQLLQQPQHPSVHQLSTGCTTSKLLLSPSSSEKKMATAALEGRKS